MKAEKKFQQMLTKTAPLMKCRIIDIPDMIVPKGWKKPQQFRERRRPFDCLLVTPTAMFGLELKANTGKQSPHQKEKEWLYNQVNPNCYFVVRAWDKKKRGSPLTERVYDIIQHGKVIERCYELTDVIQYFKDIKQGETQ